MPGSIWRHFAGLWSWPRTSFSRSLVLRMRRANITVSHLIRSPLGPASRYRRLRLSQFTVHRMCTYFIMLVRTRAQLSFSTSSLPYMTNKGGDITVSVTTASGNKRDSFASFADQLSIPSISLGNDLKPDIKIEEYSPSDSMASSSVGSLELGPQGLSHQPVPALPAVPPATVSPHHVDSTQLIVRAYSSDAANAV